MRHRTAHFPRRLLRAVLLLAALAAGAWGTRATAGVTPVVSRVVISANATEESLQMFNLNKYPVLVQTWVDDGRLGAMPQESKAPIIALPPIFRMSAGEQTTLRLLNTGASLPTDRESVFWLNLYEIPATPKAQPPDAQTVTITMRTQLKVFVRPADTLPYPAAELPERLAFSLGRTPDRLVLSIDNPTPYHATIPAIQVDVGAQSQQATVDMIAPFSSATVNLDALRDASGTGAKLRFVSIGDDGKPVTGERDLAIGQPKASP